MVQNDRRLAAQIAEGNPGAFTEFVDTFGPRLHRLARRYASSEADAEDLTQEIFVDLYRSMGSFRGEVVLVHLDLSGCPEPLPETRPPEPTRHRSL